MADPHLLCRGTDIAIRRRWLWRRLLLLLQGCQLVAQPHCPPLRRLSLLLGSLCLRTCSLRDMATCNTAWSTLRGRRLHHCTKDVFTASLLRIMLAFGGVLGDGLNSPSGHDFCSYTVPQYMQHWHQAAHLGVGGLGGRAGLGALQRPRRLLQLRAKILHAQVQLHHFGPAAAAPVHADAIGQAVLRAGLVRRQRLQHAACSCQWRF